MVHSGVAPYATRSPLSTFGYVAATLSTLQRRHPSPLHRALHYGVAANILSPINTRASFHFVPSTHLFAAFSSSSLIFFVFIFADLPYRSTSMAPRKSTTAKRHQFGSTSRVAPPPPEDPHWFVSREAERIYHKSLCSRSFVLECGFLTSNAFFNFNIQNHRWQTLCAPPIFGVTSIVWEFHSNLPFKVGTTVFILGK